MAGKNDFLPFATNGNANVVTQAEYAGSEEQLKGMQPGMASSKLCNKVWRQASLMAATIGQIIADKNLNALDTGNVNTLKQNFIMALTKVITDTVTRFSEEIAYNGNSSDFSIRRLNSTGRTIIRGGSTYNDGAALYLYGKDFSDTLAQNGEFILLVNDGVHNSSLRLTPSGRLWVGDKEVALLESTVAAALTCNGCGESTPFELTDGNAASQIKSGFYKTESNASQGGAAGLPYAAIIQAMRGSTRGARILFPLNENNEFFSPYMQVFNETWGPLKSFVMQGDTFTGNVVGNVTGNATSASRLEASRKINNVPFNGTSDIAVTDLYTKTTNCFRLRSGWQMCYGTTQLPSGASGETITFPLPFDTVPNVQATIVNSSIALGIPTVNNTSATFVTSSNNAYIRWIAVGSWS